MLIFQYHYHSESTVSPLWIRASELGNSRLSKVKLDPGFCVLKEILHHNVQITSDNKNNCLSSSLLELVVCLYLLLSLSVFTRSCIIMVRTMAGVALTIAGKEFVSLWGISFWSVGAAHEKCKLETEAKLKSFLANFSVWNLSVKLFLVGFSSSCVSSSLPAVEQSAW